MRNGAADMARGRQRLSRPSVQINLNLSLRPGEDDDLLQFFAAIPPGRRAAAIKQALRNGGLGTVTADLIADDAELLAQANSLLF